MYLGYGARYIMVICTGRSYGEEARRDLAIFAHLPLIFDPAFEGLCGAWTPVRASTGRGGPGRISRPCAMDLTSLSTLEPVNSKREKGRGKLSTRCTGVRDSTRPRERCQIGCVESFDWSVNVSASLAARSTLLASSKEDHTSSERWILLIVAPARLAFVPP